MVDKLFDFMVVLIFMLLHANQLAYTADNIYEATPNFFFRIIPQVTITKVNRTNKYAYRIFSSFTVSFFVVELFQSCIGKSSKEFCVYVKRVNERASQKTIVLDRGEMLRKYIDLMESVSNDKQTHSHFTYIEFQCKNCNVEIVSTPLSAATPQNDLQC